MGERPNGALRLDFDTRLKLEFHGAKITSEAGLRAYRELDERFGLTRSAADKLLDTRPGKDTQHSMLAVLRQAVYGPCPDLTRGTAGPTYAAQARDSAGEVCQQGRHRPLGDGFRASKGR